MIIGVPKEIKEQEHRVALLPSAAYQLVKRGHQVLVERGAGVGTGYADAEYEAAGAKLVKDHAAVFEQAELIVKVKEPLPAEWPLLRQLCLDKKLKANDLPDAWLAAAVLHLGEHLVTFDADFRKLLRRERVTVLEPD